MSARCVGCAKEFQDLGVLLSHAQHCAEYQREMQRRGQGQQGINVQATLNDRTKRYGEYSKMAMCAQNIKSAMWNSEGYNRLPDVMRESLEMIALKIARIISGDCHEVDNWHDVQGYAKLIEDRLHPGRERDLTSEKRA